MHFLQELVENYGYLAIWIGTFLEGETILVLGGWAAHQEYLSLHWVILAAFTGSFCGDQTWFYLARRFGKSFLQGRPRLAGKVAKVTNVLTRYPTLFILSFRFFYGIRNVAPLAIALSGVPTRRFVILNAIAAFIWAVAGACLGYFLGTAVETALGKVHEGQKQVLIAIGLVVVLFILHRLIKNWVVQAAARRKLARETAPPSAAIESARNPP
jgi:membrane protein DedA with SNARE-associated domain